MHFTSDSRIFAHIVSEASLLTKWEQTGKVVRIQHVIQKRKARLTV